MWHTGRVVIPARSNQYIRRSYQLGVTGTDLLAQAAAGQDISQLVKCDQIWDNYCQVLVGPPSWSHGTHPSPISKRRAAIWPSTPPTVLAWLAENPGGMPDSNRQPRPPDTRVLERVASNPHTPPATLGKLAHSPYITVVREAAGNINTPPEVLGWLSLHADLSNICEKVAGNPSSPITTLSQLAQDTHSNVRLQIAMNGSTPLAVLELLIRDTNSEVAAAAAYHPAVPAAIRAMWQLTQ